MTQKKRVMALGFFDGVHIGHGALLEKTKQRAEENHAVPSVLTFDVHPDDLIFNAHIRLLSDAENRKETIQRCYGIEDVIVLHFDRELMNMPWELFACKIIEEMNICALVVGHDFTFGQGGKGTAEKLQKFCAERNIGCDVIAPVMLDGQIISSTYIRSLIEEGRVEAAERWLGHPYSLCDTVHHGFALGRKLDAPTINMFFPKGAAELKHGVYATKAVLPTGKSYIAVTNVGVNPTVRNEGKLSVESHLLGYAGNLYGEKVRIDFYRYLREEKKFNSVEELSAQIKRDEKQALEILQ